MDTLCRIPISKPLTHRIILIKEKFSGMSLTRERTHELDKIFIHLIMTGYTFCKSVHVNQHVVVFLFSMLFFKKCHCVCPI